MLCPDFLAPSLYKIDITGAAEISSIEMTRGTFSGKTVTKTATPFLDLGADTLAALGGAVPGKWGA